MEEVTDPSTLDQLNGGMQEVTDPATLSQLNAPDEGALMAAGRGALRNVPFAQQAVAGLESGDYGQNLKGLVSGAEAAKVAHPVAYGAGAVGGTLAPMLLPVAGEALEASEPVMAGLEAASGSGIGGGAANAAAQSLSDANFKNLKPDDYKNALQSGLIGGTLGAATKGIQALAPSENNLASSMTGTGLGFNSRGAQKLMTGADPQAEVAGLGRWANEATTSAGKKISDELRPGDQIKILNQLHDEAGETIGNILKEVAPEASLPKASLTKDLYPLADELETLAPKEHGDVMGVINKINKLSDEGRLDLPALNKIKSFVGQAAQDNPTMARIYGHLSDSVNNAIDEYGRVIQDPSTRKVFDAARTNYRNASLLRPILSKWTGREMAQGPLGNSGLLGMIGGAGALAAGHPVGAAATMAGSAVGRPIANLLGRHAMLKGVPNAGAIAAGGRGLSKAAQLELANLLSSKFGGK